MVPRSGARVGHCGGRRRRCRRGGWRPGRSWSGCRRRPWPGCAGHSRRRRPRSCSTRTRRARWPGVQTVVHTPVVACTRSHAGEARSGVGGGAGDGHVPGRGDRGRSSRSGRCCRRGGWSPSRCASSRRCRSRRRARRAARRPPWSCRSCRCRARRCWCSDGPGAQAGGGGREDDRREPRLESAVAVSRTEPRSGVPGSVSATATVLKSAAAEKVSAGIGGGGDEGGLRLRKADREQDRQQEQPHQGAGQAGGCAAVSGHGRRNRARTPAIAFAIGRSEARLRPRVGQDVRTAGVAASTAKKAQCPSNHCREVPVNTRTIAVVALVIAVIVLILLLMCRGGSPQPP